MGQILIVKTGTTLPALRSRRGDLEHWILAGMQVDAARTRILDVRNGSAPPDFSGLSGVVITGSHEMDPHQAFVVEESAWGVQFHPEFDAEIVVAYIRSFRDDLLVGNQDPDRLMETCVETLLSYEILKRFAQVIEKASGSFV